MKTMTTLSAAAAASLSCTVFASVEYAIDNGVMNVAVGPPSSFPVDPETLWGNYFTVVEGGEVITTISFALGTNFPDDREVTVVLFDDPDDDFDPSNAIPVATATAVPKHLGGSVFNHFEIEPTQVSGGFFVAVFAFTEAGVDRPAALDTSHAGDLSWLVYNPANKGVNLDNLGENAFIGRLDETVGVFSGAWLIRATGIPAARPVPGDLNGDGVVDVFDLLILLGNWGECNDPADCPADLNGDGVVDVFDLLILLGNWG